MNWREAVEFQDSAAREDWNVVVSSIAVSPVEITQAVDLDALLAQKVEQAKASLKAYIETHWDEILEASRA